MRHLELEQGTEAWLKARLERFTASEAAAMFGVHKYISRTQLLDHKKGWTTEVDSFTQLLFDKGHATEEMARPLAEQVAGEDFAAVVGELEDSMFLASFDGMSMLGDVLFEHKLYNKTLAENVRNDKLEPHYYWQLEHQLLVSGAEKCLFVTSDGTKDNWADMYYVSVPGRREELIAGWEQFAKDLENHQPQAKTEKVEAEEIKNLPAISYKMDGLSLSSNLDAYKAAATDLVEKSSLPIETDQDFANAESMVKIFKSAEDDIKAISKRVLSEVADIEAFTKDLEFIGEKIRQARLATNKQVTTRKEEIRASILVNSTNEVHDYYDAINTELKVNLPQESISIANAMKGKKTVDSLQDSADTAVAQIKIDADKLKYIASSNIATLKEFAADYRFLFSDWKDIAFKANDDFTALVKTRIAEYQAEEAKRLEAQRAQIRAEEEAKAKAKVDAEKAEIERLERVKQSEIQAEQDKLQREKLEVTQQEPTHHEQTQEVKPDTQEKPAPKVVQSVSEGRSTNAPQALNDYQQGYIDGLAAYAYWKDGTQLVGTCGVTLQHAQQQFLNKAAA